jgi:hypothetical protein
MKLRQRALVTVAATAVLGVMGAVAAVPASADTGTFTNDPVAGPILSAQNRGVGLFVNMVTAAFASSFVWHPNDATTEIRVRDTQDCMQVVPSSSYEVRIAACDGGADQTFIPNPVPGGYEFIWDSNTSLCLNDHYDNEPTADLNATTCNSDPAAETDQTFFSG